MSLIFTTALVAVILVSVANANYTLVDDFSGASFFDNLDFFTGSDPTNGFVNWVDYDTAVDRELIGLVHNNDSSVFLGLDSHNVSSETGRASVRVMSRQSWNHGLLIADIKAAPSGCGTWPSLWLLSSTETWPIGGEIDLFEVVNGATSNSMTLHTNAGCAVTNSTNAFTGTMATSDCDVNDPSQSKNSGCSIRAPENETITMDGYTCTHSTAGPEFNAQGGGVYAMLWTSSGITIWFYPRGYIPSDITAGTPDPASWTQKPAAVFAGPGCDFDSHFTNLSLVVDSDLCGDWSGEVWTSGGCAASTGYSTCAEFVGKNPKEFADAYWLFNSIKMYQNASDAGTSSHVKRDVHVERERAIPDISRLGHGNGTAAAALRTFPTAPAYRAFGPVQSSGAICLRAGIEHESATSTKMVAIVGTVVAVVFAAMMA